MNKAKYVGRAINGDLTELPCGICGEEIWWDETPNPICVGCADSPDKRLNAAAPDMLQALRMLLQAYGPSSGWSQGARDAWEAAEAAVAKAEGR
jgi:hypothetical protein